MNIVGIGLANIDLISHVSEEFLSTHNLIKGQAKRLNSSRFFKLRDQLQDIEIEAGGCVGNTLCGLNKDNIKATFFGKIGNNSYAKNYRQSFQKYDVLYPVKNAKTESSQCAVLITPDGERTFAYIHGASWTLSPSDIYFETIKKSDLVYTEIYAMAFGMQTGLWPSLVNFMRDEEKTMAMKVVDKEYMALYKTALFGLAEEGILTLLVGNKDNLCALANRDNIDEALKALAKWQCAILLTDGANGAYYNDGPDRYHHAVTPIEHPINTSGAGDQFVAGFLEKWVESKPIEICMKSAEQAAYKVLMSDSPRPAL